MVGGSATGFAAMRSVVAIGSVVLPSWPDEGPARVAGAPSAARLASMSTISREEVARLAGLARIDLTESELTRLAGELDVIVQAVAAVSALVTDDVPATSHPMPLSNVTRADVLTTPLAVADAIAAAPAAQGDRFVVPQILEED